MARLAGVVTCLLLAYALPAGYFLHVFYLRGVGDDSGWFAWLATHAHEWRVANPPLIGGYFVATHMSPVFLVTTALLAPLAALPVAVRFCLLLALWGPLLWLGVFLLAERLAFARRCALALLLTFNGIALAWLGFPHVEALIPALGLLAIALWLRARTAIGWGLAAAALLLALSVREDAGLHLAIAVMAMAWVRPGARVFALAGLCVLGAGLALWGQHQALPAGRALLGEVYLGHPPLAHLSAEGLAGRLLHWATRRQYILLPLLALLLCGLWLPPRDRRLLAGVAIALPWLGLALVAASTQAGDLVSYYGFPLVFMLCWPLLLARMDPRVPVMGVQAAMGALSLLAFVVVGVLPAAVVGGGGLHDRAPWRHVLPPAPDTIRRTEAALAGRTGWLFDYGTAALAFGALAPGQFRPGLDYGEAELAAAPGFVRFAPQLPALAPQMARMTRAFPACAPVEGTALLLCTRP